MTHQELVLSALCKIKADGPLRPANGICANATQHIERHTGTYLEVTRQRWFKTLIKQWPDRWISTDNNLSEELAFSVGGFEEYELIGNLWDNPRRLALLDYLIEQIRPLTFQVIP